MSINNDRSKNIWHWKFSKFRKSVDGINGIVEGWLIVDVTTTRSQDSTHSTWHSPYQVSKTNSPRATEACCTVTRKCAAVVPGSSMSRIWNAIWTPSQYPKRRLFVRSRKVSKPRDWYFKLWHRFEIWQAHRQQCCRSACQISERSDNSKYKSRGLETLRDLMERRIFGYWDGALVPEMFSGVHIRILGWPIYDLHGLVLPEIPSGLGCLGRILGWFLPRLTTSWTRKKLFWKVALDQGKRLCCTSTLAGSWCCSTLPNIYVKAIMIPNWTVPEFASPCYALWQSWKFDIWKPSNLAVCEYIYDLHSMSSL